MASLNSAWRCISARFARNSLHLRLSAARSVSPMQRNEVRLEKSMLAVDGDPLRNRRLRPALTLLLFIAAATCMSMKSAQRSARWMPSAVR